MQLSDGFETPRNPWINKPRDAHQRNEETGPTNVETNQMNEPVN